MIDPNTARVCASILASTRAIPRPFVVDGTDALLGSPVSDAGAAELPPLLRHQVQPMRTAAIGSNWRREVAAVHAMRLRRELAADAAPAR